MRKRPLCTAAVCFLVIQLILTGGFRNAKDLKPSSLESLAEKKDTLTVQGKVLRREQSDTYHIYYLTDCFIRIKNQTLQEKKLLVYANLKLSENIKVGNKLLVKGEVNLFDSPSNPGTFDRKFYYQKQGIHAQIWANSIEIKNFSYWKIPECLTKFRYYAARKFEEIMGKIYGGIMSAILLGEKKELNVQIKELYQKSGIGHILAISGLHMSFLGVGVYHILRKFGLGYGIAGLGGTLVLLLYTCITGIGVSSLRAFLMFVIKIGAEITGRTYDMPTSLSVAAVITMMWQPLYLLDTGFWLSFGAVFAINVFHPFLMQYKIFPQYLCSGIAVQIVLTPILLWAYFELSFWSIVLNLLLLPVMPILLGAGVTGIVFFILFPAWAKIPLFICKYILIIYENFCEVTLKLPGNRYVFGKPSKFLVVVYYISLVFLCLLIAKKYIRRMVLFIFPISVGIFCMGVHMQYTFSKKLQIFMLDVGQGDGFYIRSPEGISYLIDGGSADEAQIGRYCLEPFLKSRGVRKIDYVLITHGDKDHTNGILELLGNQKLGIRIETLILPTIEVFDENLYEIAKVARKHDTEVLSIQQGDKIKDGEVVWTCLSPENSFEGESGNEASLILSLQYRDFDMLFTGDVEGYGEENLVKIFTENPEWGRDYDILKVAHHGSKNSTKEEFLKKINPKIAFISAGENNFYGHPHQETLKRLSSIGCDIYLSAKNGAVQLKTDGKKLLIDTTFSDIIKTL